MLAFEHDAGGFGTLGTLASDAETSGGSISLQTAIIDETMAQIGLYTNLCLDSRTLNNKPETLTLAYPSPLGWLFMDF
jgi:hypothetical protein